MLTFVCRTLFCIPTRAAQSTASVGYVFFRFWFLYPFGICYEWLLGAVPNFILFCFGVPVTPSLLRLLSANAPSIPFHQFTCKSNEFQCHDGICVTGYKRCNGIVDCPDDSDEIDCPTMHPFDYGIFFFFFDSKCKLKFFVPTAPTHDILFYEQNHLKIVFILIDIIAKISNNQQ